MEIDQLSKSKKRKKKAVVRKGKLARPEDPLLGSLFVDKESRFAMQGEQAADQEGRPSVPFGRYRSSLQESDRRGFPPLLAILRHM